eukprot:scpid65686/ scgid15784/ 
MKLKKINIAGLCIHYSETYFVHCQPKQRNNCFLTARSASCAACSLLFWFVVFAAVAAAVALLPPSLPHATGLFLLSGLRPPLRKSADVFSALKSCGKDNLVATLLLLVMAELLFCDIVTAMIVSLFWHSS